MDFRFELDSVRIPTIIRKPFHNDMFIEWIGALGGV